MWQAIITSPLQRARRSADIIADVLGISAQMVHEDNGLIERDYGKASGLMPEERRIMFPDSIYEDIEDWQSLRDRMIRTLENYADKFYPGNIIMVSHGGAINAVLAELSGHRIGTGKTRLKNACVNMLSYDNCENYDDDGKKFSIVFFNKSADEFFA